MKNGRRLILALAILIISSLQGKQISAQSGWEMVYSETGFGAIIKEICFVPGSDSLWNTGWAVQYKGTILKTTDGGDTWTAFNQTYSSNLWGISFVDENIGYVCDLDGQILKSYDGGESWTRVYNNPDHNFAKIEFKDADNGIAIGAVQHVYTNDGGETWSQSTGGSDYWRCDYTDGDTYFAVEAVNGNVGKTTDNGATWTDVYTTPAMAMCVDFLDHERGIIGTGGAFAVKYTHDAGESWYNSNVGTSGAGDILAADWFDQDTVWVCGSGIHKSTDGGVTWTQDTTMTGDDIFNREMFLTDRNVVFVSGDIFETHEAQIWRKIEILPLYAIFEASDTQVCDGSVVDFTDQSYYDAVSWDWTFEGGTPATSSDQHPSITYNEGGIFDVTLIATNTDGNSDTLIITDYIEVLAEPQQPPIPTGDEYVCSGNTYTYSVPEIIHTRSYTWELLPEDAGEISWTDNIAEFAVADGWTGEFLIRVVAFNDCYNGTWSENFEGISFLSPDAYSLQGSGSYCEGEQGVEITLDGSQTGIDYELLHEGNPTGIIISGTGGEISFGFQTDPGIYEAIGFNENCEEYMSEQVEIVVLELPSPAITGSALVCDNDITEYETTENAGSTYSWEITGGTILEGNGTHMIMVEWGEAGNGTIEVTELDANGCEATTAPFEVLIDDCTDIPENDLQNNIRIYPNPANDRLNIEMISDNQIKTLVVIYNQLGIEVLKTESVNSNMNNHQQLDISKLKKGLYFIKVQMSGHQPVTKKFIKN